MNRPHLLPHARAHGFSLIELVIIIVVMAIAATGIIALNAGIFSGQTTNTQLQVSSALMQECGELVLAIRQKEGFTSTKLNNSTNATIAVGCDKATSTGYGPPTVTIASPTGSAAAACPTGRNCKLVTIVLVKPDIALLLAE